MGFPARPGAARAHVQLPLRRAQFPRDSLRSALSRNPPGRNPDQPHPRERALLHRRSGGVLRRSAAGGAGHGAAGPLPFRRLPRREPDGLRARRLRAGRPPDARVPPHLPRRSRRSGALPPVRVPGDRVRLRGLRRAHRRELRGRRFPARHPHRRHPHGPVHARIRRGPPARRGQRGANRARALPRPSRRTRPHVRAGRVHGGGRRSAILHPRLARGRARPLPLAHAARLRGHLHERRHAHGGWGLRGRRAPAPLPHRQRSYGPARRRGQALGRALRRDAAGYRPDGADERPRGQRRLRHLPRRRGARLRAGRVYGRGRRGRVHPPPLTPSIPTTCPLAASATASTTSTSSSGSMGTEATGAASPPCPCPITPSPASARASTTKRASGGRRSSAGRPTGSERGHAPSPRGRAAP